jgi:hypothetical protein
MSTAKMVFDGARFADPVFADRFFIANHLHLPCGGRLRWNVP